MDAEPFAAAKVVDNSLWLIVQVYGYLRYAILPEQEHNVLKQRSFSHR
jgi:hypothetical protein